MFVLSLLRYPSHVPGIEVAGLRKGMHRLSIKMPGSVARWLGGSWVVRLLCLGSLWPGPRDRQHAQDLPVLAGSLSICMPADIYLWISLPPRTLSSHAFMGTKCRNAEMPRNPDAHLLPSAKGPASCRLFFMCRCPTNASNHLFF